MSVIINAIEKNSIADKKKISQGDKIISINDNEINDVLDFDFYVADQKLLIEIEKPNGKQKKVKIKKSEYEDIGITFDSYLIDKQHSCTNNCVFCFVDQMPSGMRESLYFKDDDDRLSFIFGNYITLTNMKEKEIDRIIKMHISPINISVHTTNPELRVKMMKNRFAGETLAYIEKLANAGIKLNCQLVLCPNINDGEELKRSLSDLSKFFPSVQTIACVPVGVTKFRDGLEKLDLYTKETAGETIDIIESFSNVFFHKHQTRVAYPADEFFIKANRPIPQTDYYGDFSQLDNGVGMISMQKKEFMDALEDLPPSDQKHKFSVATGVDAKPFIQILVDELKKKWHNLECSVFSIENNYFGKTITVAGLVTGTDLIAQLKGKDLGERLLIPACMLRHEQDLFLDNISLEQVKQELDIEIVICQNDGYEILEAFTNHKTEY